MKKNHAINLFLLFLAMPFINAFAEPHAHGHANLNIVKENSLLEAMLISPAINIVGFEHPFSNAKEKLVIEQKNILKVETAL